MEGSDVCFAPVLTIAEAPRHPHNRARGTFVEVGGRGAAAPRAALQPHRRARSRARPRAVGEHTDEALRDWGFAAAEIAKLRDEKAIG